MIINMHSKTASDVVQDLVANKPLNLKVDAGMRTGR